MHCLRVQLRPSDACLTKEFYSTDGPVVLGRGRGPACWDPSSGTLRTPGSPVMSGRHAKLTFDEHTGVSVTDLDSTNGTYLTRNGSSESRPLQPNVPYKVSSEMCAWM